jgi:hypothetical protein
MAQRIIRLLNGGEHRRPSVRPSELARAGRGARISGVPHECPLVCARRSAWQNPDWLPAVDQFGESVFIQFSSNALSKWPSHPAVL